MKWLHNNNLWLQLTPHFKGQTLHSQNCKTAPKQTGKEVAANATRSLAALPNDNAKLHLYRGRRAASDVEEIQYI